MAVFDLDPARAVIIIVADGSYTGVIGSFAYIESRAGCGVYGAAVKVYRCVLGAVGNIDRVASSPDVGIGQCEVRIGGNREGVKVALCGGVKGACATAAGAEGKLDLSALGNLKAAARVDAFYVIVELVALLRVCPVTVINLPLELILKSQPESIPCDHASIKLLQPFWAV